ncbi:hypothetical protein MMPV_005524 [Pyropia vietnamensis]
MAPPPSSTPTAVAPAPAAGAVVTGTVTPAPDSGAAAGAAGVGGGGGGDGAAAAPAASAALSKRAAKRAAKAARVAAGRAAKKAAAKAARAAARPATAPRAGGPDRGGGRGDGGGGNSGGDGGDGDGGDGLAAAAATPSAATLARRARKAADRSRLLSGAGCPTVLVDCRAEWAAAMTPREVKSLCRQLAYVYSVSARAVAAGRVPLRVVLTGDVATVLDALHEHWRRWPVVVEAQELGGGASTSGSARQQGDVAAAAGGANGGDSGKGSDVSVGGGGRDGTRGTSGEGAGRVAAGDVGSPTPRAPSPAALNSAPWAAGIAPSDIVYLTADAPTTLTTVTPGKVYILGGMVDRNRLKGAAAAAAAGLGVATASLDLGPPAGCRGTRVLTILHVAALLSAVANGATWAEAVATVLPQPEGRDIGNGTAATVVAPAAPVEAEGRGGADPLGGRGQKRPRPAAATDDGEDTAGGGRGAPTNEATVATAADASGVAPGVAPGGFPDAAVSDTTAGAATDAGATALIPPSPVPAAAGVPAAAAPVAGRASLPVAGDAMTMLPRSPPPPPPPRDG